MKGRVLIIAGSDSGGGAGVQADIKTVTALGGYAATAITALTAQDTQEVYDIVEAPAAFVRRQIRACLDDIGADAVKTGMLANADIISAVAEEIDAAVQTIPLVVDPVMQAKAGAMLLADGHAGGVKAELVRLCALFTPNIPEAEAMTGYKINSRDDMFHAAELLMTLGPKAVLLKGGHLEGATLTDILMTEDDTIAFDGPRIDTPHTHGTGCTTASAIATGLAQGLDIRAAVERARAYVLKAIESAPGFGKGHGPLNHGHGIQP